MTATYPFMFITSDCIRKLLQHPKAGRSSWDSLRPAFRLILSHVRYRFIEDNETRHGLCALDKTLGAIKHDNPFCILTHHQSRL